MKLMTNEMIDKVIDALAETEFHACCALSDDPQNEALQEAHKHAIEALETFAKAIGRIK